MPDVFDFDAYTPAEIAQRIETIAVKKVRLTFIQTAMLGMLAGAFIGFGALFYTIVASDPDLGYAATRVLGGVAFSLGLILVVVGGAELFTGNNLLVMAWADRRVTTPQLLRNWAIVYVSNAIGALGLAFMVAWSNHPSNNQHAVALEAIAIAHAKASLPFAEAFLRGVLCNVLVCLAVWLSMAGHTVTDKILAIVFPISAFVAAGFEHSIANMYFIPLGILAAADLPAGAAAQIEPLSWTALASNLLPVTLGNIVGGGVFVAAVYYLIYRYRNGSSSQ
jgi:formate/nitrite transporter